MEARSGSEVRPDTVALRALADEWHSVTIDPTTVRALCDAADEVERLRRAVWASEEIDRRAGMLAGVEAERDASRTEVERLREDVEALHGLLSAGAIGTAPGSDSHRMVLAMRDHYKRERDAARDEVERLRAAVVERDTRLAETIRYHDARVNRADEATDASRTAHAALVADLRALVGGDELVSQRAVNPDEYTRRTGDRVPSYLAFYQGAADLAAVIRALLDRHAPTTGETP